MRKRCIKCKQHYYTLNIQRKKCFDCENNVKEIATTKEQHFRLKLRKLRKKHGYTIAELAKGTGTSTATIQNIETCKKEDLISLLFLMIDYYEKVGIHINIDVNEN